MGGAVCVFITQRFSPSVEEDVQPSPGKLSVDVYVQPDALYNKKHCNTWPVRSHTMWNPASEWRGLQIMTDCRRPSTHPVENKRLADETNYFYCMFWYHTSLNLQPSSTVPAPTIPPSLPIWFPAWTVICEGRTCLFFQRLNTRKVPGPNEPCHSWQLVLSTGLHSDLQQIIGAMWIPLLP